MTTLRLRSPHRCRPPALAAAATLAALSGPAHAQSTLTLYGVADAGVQYLSRADGRHAAWRLQNYGILPSQLGIKGEEDLGGGWRASSSSRAST
ncbi:gram-negative porin family protein [Burkholderia pseudomallei]|nr:gram-negative porin family protein [Burkholderia pseudomallei]